MKVLVASKSLPVFDVLQGVRDVEHRVALFTGQVYDTLPGSDLVIIDFDDLVPHPYSVEMLKGVLAEAGVLFVASAEFLAQPDRWITEARRRRGEIHQLPDKRTIAFVSYSGGTGKSTLAIDTALHFARRTRMPTLLTEFCHGESSLATLTGLEMPHLFDLVTQLDLRPRKWQGVTLIPMDYENCRDLSANLIGKYLKEQMAAHVLTVVDCRWPHALVSPVRDEVDQWFVVGAPRADAVENARKLAQELGSKAAIILNQKGGALDGLALSGVERALDLPLIGQPERFEGQLGKAVLAQTYGPQTWRKYEPKSALARLGAAFGLGGHR